MKVIWKLKRHYPQDLETISEEETEEITPASPPHKLATCAPPVYVVSHNDNDKELLLFDRNLFGLVSIY
jgi:hypothetical protein